MKKTLKTLLPILLVAVLACCLVMAVACEKEPVLGDWQSDANGHWKEATNEGFEGIKYEEGAHTYDDDADKSCNVCGYERVIAPVEDLTSDVNLLQSDFQNGVASVVVSGDRKVIIAARSNEILIQAQGAFSVKIGDAAAVNSQDNALTIENGADVQQLFEIVIHSDSKLTLTLTLKYNLGTEQNPHVISGSEANEISVLESAYISVSEAGWYKVQSQAEVELVNYSLGSDGIVYLAAGIYNIGSSSDSAVSVSIEKQASAPNGYSNETAVSASQALPYYNGLVCYFSYTAPKAGAYSIALDAQEGISANARFTTSKDSEGVYYGKHLDEDAFVPYASEVKSVVLAKGESIVIAVDHTSDAVVGNSNVKLAISEIQAIEIEAASDHADGALVAGGIVVFKYVAAQRCKYQINLGLGDVNNACRFVVTSDTEQKYYANNTENSAAYVTLNLGEEVIIVVDSANATTAGSVRLLVVETLEEALPTTGWASGRYVADDGYMSVVIDRESKTVEYLSFDAARFYYLDGIASFKVSAGSFTISANDDGTVLTVKDASGKTICVCEYKPPVVAVAIAKWEGVYESQTAIDDVTKIEVWSDGSGKFGTYIYRASNYQTNYNTEENILTWNYSAIKLEINELDNDGNVSSIKVTVGAESVIFTKTNEQVNVIPGSLAIASGTYTGELNTLTNSYGWQSMNDGSIEILAYQSGEYKVSIYDFQSGETYIYFIAVEGDEEETTAILLYNEEHILLDTLVPGGAQQAIEWFDVVGKYNGSDGNDSSIVIVLKENYSVDYNGAYGDEYSGLEVTQSDSNPNEYTFSYDDPYIGACMVTITLNADGTITVWDSAEYTCSLAAIAWADMVGSYVGLNDNLEQIGLVLYADGTIDYAPTYGGPHNGLQAVQDSSNPNMYTFTYTDWGVDVNCTIVLKDGSIVLKDMMDYTCYKTQGGDSGDEDEPAEAISWASMVGSYSGSNSFGDAHVSIVLNADGTVSYTNAVSKTYSNITVTQDQTNPNKYTFSYTVAEMGDFNVEIVFNANGTITLSDGDSFTCSTGSQGGSEDEDGMFSNDQIGRYMFSDESVIYILVLSNDASELSYYDSASSYDVLVITESDGTYSIAASSSKDNTLSTTASFVFNNDGTITLTTASEAEITLSSASLM